MNSDRYKKIKKFYDELRESAYSTSLSDSHDPLMIDAKLVINDIDFLITEVEIAQMKAEILEHSSLIISQLLKQMEK